jgi:prepilin-type N-terminal cleavage/methylation domain-containing protein
MKKNKARLDNRGVTLVELLISVLILGIVTAPLLHTFFTSATTAQKSRQFGDATTCAQNLIETIQEMQVDTLLADATSLGAAGAKFYLPASESSLEDTDGDGFSLTAGPTPGSEAVKDSTGKYYIGLHGISSGSSSFDALITLDAQHDLNSEPVTKYTDLIATVQPDPNPDDGARTAFEDDCDALGAILGTISLQRTITIDVETGTAIGGGDVRFPVYIHYSYTGGFQYLDEEGNTKPHYFSWTPTEGPSIAYYIAKAEDLTGDKPAFSMYFFFDSFYGSPGYGDTVKVYNDKNNGGPGSHDLFFNLFLVRQKTSETSVKEASYSAQILQYEPFGLGLDTNGLTNIPACKVYTNMNMNLNPGAVSTPPFQYLVYKDPLWYVGITQEPKLVVSDIMDRLLYVNVKLYKAGEGFDGKELVSMDATKLD